MKKLLFTALAITAFSGAAMANTAVVQEEVIVYDTDCTDVYHETYIEFVDLGLEEEAAAEAFAAFKDCEGLN